MPMPSAKPVALSGSFLSPLHSAIATGRRGTKWLAAVESAQQRWLALARAYEGLRGSKHGRMLSVDAVVDFTTHDARHR